MESKQFPGQHNDERVLYIVRQHWTGTFERLVKVVFVVVAIWVLSWFAGRVNSGLSVIGFLFGVVVGLAGSWFVMRIGQWSRGYVTDRRIVRFDAATPFTWSSRSLNWDDTLKVKTYAPNILWRFFRVGRVVIHAKSTMVGVTEAPKGILTNDDIDLDYVYYYNDLGNYIDKILYIYKNNPQEIEALRDFVPKPRGQRY